MPVPGTDGRNGSVEALDEKILDSGWKVELDVKQILDRISDVGDNAAEYGDQILRLSDNLDGTGDIRGLIAGLIDETRRMNQRNRQLEERIRGSTGKISELNLSMEETRREARMDPLTGIGNRKDFDAKLAEAVADSLGNQTPMCLIMADIDFFKRFNDEFGHRTGDQVLKLVAHTLRREIKGSDTVARYGGEEFALILPQTCLMDALTLGNKLRTKVAAKKIVKKNSNVAIGAVTLSLGVAEIRPGETPADLISRADKAVYAAKGNGRNRIRRRGRARVSQRQPPNANRPSAGKGVVGPGLEQGRRHPANALDVALTKNLLSRNDEGVFFRRHATCDVAGQQVVLENQDRFDALVFDLDPIDVEGRIATYSGFGFGPGRRGVACQHHHEPSHQRAGKQPKKFPAHFPLAVLLPTWPFSHGHAS